MRRRPAVALVLVLALAAVTVAYGRAEGRSAIRDQQRGLLALRAAVGARLARPGAAIYDPHSALECLTYAAAAQRYGLELCFDSSGRLTEGVDRRAGERIWSVRWDRSGAPLTIGPQALHHAVGHIPVASRQTGLLP